VTEGTAERSALRGTLAGALLCVLVASTASAQVNGFGSLIVDTLPDVDEAGGAQSAAEMRVRLFAERRDELGPHVRINLGAYVDGLLADRSSIAGVGGPGGAAYNNRDAIVRPADLYVDVVTSRFDLRAGAARLVWGRLDEFQPTDVVNPIDLSRFLMEGRSEARLPVGLVRARVFLPRSTTLEAVVVPHFRRGRFDQLEEPSSPFNLTRSPIPRVTDEPEFGRSLQGGLRLTSTTARVDWSVSGYRGIRAFPVSSAGVDLQLGPYVRESFPWFTMVGGDFETVRGAWGVRGEVAAFVDDELQSTRTLQGVEGHSVTAGIGVDRKAGDYRVSANALWSRSSVDGGRTDASLVIAADRSFARETRTLRLFAVYDPADATTFTRVIAAVSLRDNLWLEGSGGLFAGSSLDIIGQLTRRDFAYARLKVFF
jgi:hypothetical protein